ncbi:hypothetical protein BD626DRAFT_518921 [Schizophyllum amplum]|uniref:F-box domain-containing protein n=1 Tax=Schizophyllum amplum TaxID=97359 RepID=A0A550BVP6_9AGAR|nr:hypothetical protein BD626DRAFT_518921 [Auriculariopsis ampla]
MQRHDLVPDPARADDVAPTSFQLEETGAQIELLSSDADNEAPRAAFDEAVSSVGFKEPVTAPVHCLPPELLADIFLYLPSRENMCDELVRLEYGIARVCTTWRHVALGTPMLWTCIDIQSKNIDPEQYLRQYLPRSHNRPLHIACDYDRQPKLLRLLSVHAAHRWQTLTLRVSRYDPLPDTMPTAVAAPLLERVKVKIGGEGYETEVSDLLAFLQHTPRLRELVVKGGSLKTFALCGLPWSPALTHVHIAVDGFHEFPLILRSVQEFGATLTTLRLGLRASVLVGLAEDEEQEGIVTLPALRYLRLYNYGYELLWLINAPNLHTLSVDMDALAKSAAFLNFVKRGGARMNIRALEVITVYPKMYIDGGRAEFARLLCCMIGLESLERLRIVRYPAVEEFLMALAWRNHASRILPNLQMISIPGLSAQSIVLAELCRTRRMTTVSCGREIFAMAEGRQFEMLRGDLSL